MLIRVDTTILTRDALKIVKTLRFDDVDYDMGYAYRGFNYVIQNNDDEFLVRMYEDEPGAASVVSPTQMSKNRNLRKLVDFLKSELAVSKIYLLKGELGSYAELDLDSLAFCIV